MDVDDDTTIKLHSRDGEPLLFIVRLTNDKKNIWLETESDNDMVTEINTRFENALENQLEELDFYNDLLETGIDVVMVRKYMGDKCADCMEEFYEEHGLI